MAGIQKGGRLLACGQIDLQSEGAWLVGDADRIPDPVGIHDQVRSKFWVANPGSRYDAARGGHVRKIAERAKVHECVRVMKGRLGWWPGEAAEARYYSLLKGNCNLGEHDEGRWILPPGCQERVVGSTLLTPHSVPYPQDGYSRLCEQHFVAAGLCESKDALIKRLSWPDQAETLAWKKTLITVFDGALEILDDAVRTDGGMHVAQVLKAGGYAFFEAFEWHNLERDGPRPSLPLRYSPLGNLVASVLFF